MPEAHASLTDVASAGVQLQTLLSLLSKAVNNIPQNPTAADVQGSDIPESEAPFNMIHCSHSTNDLVKDSGWSTAYHLAEAASDIICSGEPLTLDAVQDRARRFLGNFNVVDYFNSQSRSSSSCAYQLFCNSISSLLGFNRHAHIRWVRQHFGKATQMKIIALKIPSHQMTMIVNATEGKSWAYFGFADNKEHQKACAAGRNIRQSNSIRNSLLWELPDGDEDCSAEKYHQKLPLQQLQEEMDAHHAEARQSRIQNERAAQQPGT